MSERQMQELAVFVHGALAFGHALGAIYNLRRKNYLDAAVHTAAMSYDIWATHKHCRALKEYEIKDQDPSSLVQR